MFGVTLREPEATGVTEPIPRLILKEVAPLVVQVRVDEVPGWMLVGDAVSVHVGAGGGGVEVTVTVALHVIVPPAPVAVPT